MIGTERTRQLDCEEYSISGLACVLGVGYTTVNRWILYGRRVPGGGRCYLRAEPGNDGTYTIHRQSVIEFYDELSQNIA